MKLATGLISAFFGLGAQYDSGVEPHVALNASGVAVEVHKSQTKGRLWYHVGSMREATVDWGGSHDYDDGITPRVALNDSGALVEIHETQSPVSSGLYYHRGTVNAASKAISFGPSRKFDDGKHPSVALTNGGAVVEVHESSNLTNNKLYYHVGQFQGDAIRWGPSLEYDNGKTPSVAINDSGVVVEVHKSQDNDNLYYHVGKVFGDGIQWGPSVKYQPGVQPSVALTKDGTVVEVHTSQGLSPALWQMTGKVVGDQIVWNGIAGNYDTGSVPSVAASGLKALQVHEGELAATLWSSNSLLTDRANWMGDRFDALKGKSLRKLAMPASHDAGMYAGNILGKTHDQDLHDQLASGFRYFDLRPGKNLKIAHGIVDGPPVQDVLDGVKRYMAEGHRELAILKFSHYGGGFGTAEYQALARMITTTLDPWLFTKKTWTGRFADAPLDSLIGGGGKVLVVCDGAFPQSNPTAGLYIYRDWDANDVNLADLTVFDVYADTMSYDTMVKDQFGKLAKFNGRCKNFNVPCDLFLLSWTLTPTTDVWTFSKVANRMLGDMMAPLVPNSGGFLPNLLYLDFGEYARGADVAIDINARP